MTLDSGHGSGHDSEPDHPGKKKPSMSFGEPWGAIEDDNVVIDRDGDVMANCYGTRHAERIVACVNYCAGITTEKLLARKRRCAEPYGDKSLRVLREATKRGLRLSADGKEIVLPSGKVSVTKKERSGYKHVNLSVDGEVVKVTRARVMCFLAHGEPPSGGMVVDHIDGDTSNDTAGNLRWATYSENTINTAERRSAALAGLDPSAVAKGLENLRAVVQAQAEDAGLWFEAKTAPEGYLQQGLRHLHAVIEEALAALEAGKEDTDPTHQPLSDWVPGQGWVRRGP